MNSFPSTMDLLSWGEDSRLLIDSESGRNHYHCSLNPDLDLLRLGSSTATAISQVGFSIADEMRNEMEKDYCQSDFDTVYELYAERICQQLRDCLALGETTAIALAESGTNAHRLAVCRVSDSIYQRSLRILMVSASETGSGVLDALCPPNRSILCSEIAIRDASNGMPIPSENIDNAVVIQVEQAIKQNEHVLLVMVDQSKSGCVVPSLSCGLLLKKRFPKQLSVLLDACQFRFSTSKLNDYLAHGMMLAITGSKFLAGPSFSAALLLPNHESAATILPKPYNLGLLVRWQVALSSLYNFSILNHCAIKDFLNLCGQAVQQRLALDPAFEPLLVSTVIKKTDREINNGTDWGDSPTIFPFRLCRPLGKNTSNFASYTDTMAIYRQLQLGDTPRIQFGRPIFAGRNNNGEECGALRLCISAPMIIEAITGQKQLSIIAQCMQALDRVSS